MPSRTHRVGPGDCLARIAKKYGFSDWRTIYDHADNAALRDKRKNPHVLHPGDEVHVPEKSDTPRSASAGQSLKFRLKTRRSVVRIRVADEQHRAIAGKKYRLKVGDRTYDGTLNSDAVVEHDVDPTVDDGELTIWFAPDNPYTFALALGHLDPIAEVSGLQARLRALGYLSGPVTGALDDATRAALRTFQAEHVTPNQEPSGEPDDATRDKLAQLGHG
jgi:Putative peptidoglycan binding domain